MPEQAALAKFDTRGHDIWCGRCSGGNNGRGLILLRARGLLLQRARVPIADEQASRPVPAKFGRRVPGQERRLAQAALPPAAVARRLRAAGAAQALAAEGSAGVKDGTVQAQEVAAP